MMHGFGGFSMGIRRIHNTLVRSLCQQSPRTHTHTQIQSIHNTKCNVIIIWFWLGSGESQANQTEGDAIEWMRDDTPVWY